MSFIDNHEIVIEIGNDLASSFESSGRDRGDDAREFGPGIVAGCAEGLITVCSEVVQVEFLCQFFAPLIGPPDWSNITTNPGKFSFSLPKP